MPRIPVASETQAVYQSVTEVSCNHGSPLKIIFVNAHKRETLGFDLVGELRLE